MAQGEAGEYIASLEARSEERVARSQESGRNFVDAKFRTDKSGLILFATTWFTEANNHQLIDGTHSV